MTRKLLSLLLCAALILSGLPLSAMLPVAVLAAETAGAFTIEGGTAGMDYSFSGTSGTDGVLTINSGTALTISTSAQISDRIVIGENVNANLTLSGVNILAPAQASAIDVSSTSSLTLTLADNSTNTLSVTDVTGNENYTNNAGIHIPSGASLTIQCASAASNGVHQCEENSNCGTLSVTGGYCQSGCAGAGIGGNLNESAGYIQICGGKITATGGSTGAGIGGAGIGGGSSYEGAGGSGGATIIAGGIVTATGGGGNTGSSAVGIGGGNSLAFGGNGGEGGTIIILTKSVTAAVGQTTVGGSPDSAIGGGLSQSTTASKGTGIEPDGDGNYQVYGDLELPDGVEIPSGVSVTIPSGASLTVPSGTELVVDGTLEVESGGSLTNSGTISGNGFLTGSGTVTNNGGTISVSNNDFAANVSLTITSDGNTVTSATYGSSVTLTATVKNGSNQAVTSGTVYFYQGSNASGTPLNSSGTSVNNGQASYNLTLNDTRWTPDTYTITAVYSGGSGLLGNNDTTTLTVNAIPLDAPAGLAWSTTTPGQATWNAVTNASGYNLQLYKDGSAQGSPVTASGTSYDFANTMTQAGSYTFTVTATGSDAYSDSSESSQSAALHTVSFDTGGTGNIPMQFVPNSEKATSPTGNLTKEGYRFDGWYSNGDFSEESKWAFDTSSVTTATTLYAKWTPLQYTVTLNANSGTITEGYDVKSYTYGTTTSLPTAEQITRTGYAFGGWYESENFSGSPVTAITATDTGAKTYYAKWISTSAGVESVSVNGTTGTINGIEINVVLPYGSSLPTDNSAITITQTTGATASVPTTNDDGATWTFTVTAEDGITTATYTINVSIAPPPAPIIPPIPSEPDDNGPTTDGSAGWSDIQTELESANDGNTITIEMNGTSEVPAEIFETIAGQDITVSFEMEGGVSWQVNGTDIPAGTRLHDLNLGVDMNTNGISANVINAITGEISTVQITLAYDGAFGFTMTLSAPLGEEHHGYWANLYYFDEAAGRLVYQTASLIDETGHAHMRMSHASQYAIVIDDYDHGGGLPFVDVSASDWYYDAVACVFDAGIMGGMSDTTFAPQIATTRAMIVSMLHRLEGVPNAEASTFSDVSAGDWYAEPVAWAASVGVVGGYPDGSFQPNKSITREELASILYRYAQWKGRDTSARADLSHYTDAPSPWAAEVMSWANAEGLINGRTATTIDAQSTLTRAECAAIFQRFIG